MKRLYRLATIGAMTFVLAAAVTPSPNTAFATKRNSTATAPAKASYETARSSGTGQIAALASIQPGATSSAGSSGYVAPAGASSSRSTPKHGGSSPTVSPQPDPTTTNTPAALDGLRLMNYFPAHHGWSRMWFEWDPTTLRNDFARMSDMGANAVRLILPTDVFGYPTASSLMLDRLSTVIDMASAAGLKVQLTLFENWSSFADVSGSQKWATQILSPFKADPRIVLVEIKNELNPYDSAAMTWARTMIPFVRSLTDAPVAVSGAGDLPWFTDLVKALDATRPDVFSYHFYGDPSNAAATFYWAKRIAAPTTVFIGEAGYSTGTSGDTASDPSLEQSQDGFFRAVEAATVSQGLPAAAPWTLWDFAPGTLCTCAPGKEYHFGLLRLDGSEKPAYATVRTFFTTGKA